MTSPSPASEAWSLVEKEKRRDRFIRRISIAAWTVVFLIVLLLAVLTGAQVADMLKVFAGGGAPWTAVFWSAMPLLIVLGTISLLIATLSTVGIFLRLRTASLTEIQLRLAALEEMLSGGPDSSRSGSR